MWEREGYGISDTVKRNPYELAWDWNCSPNELTFYDFRDIIFIENERQKQQDLQIELKIQIL